MQLGECRGFEAIGMSGSRRTVDLPAVAEDVVEDAKGNDISELSKDVKVEIVDEVLSRRTHRS